MIRKLCLALNKGETGLGVKSGVGWKGICDKKGGNLRKALGAREKPLRFAFRQLLQKSPENFLLNVSAGAWAH